MKVRRRLNQVECELILEKDDHSKELAAVKKSLGSEVVAAKRAAADSEDRARSLEEKLRYEVDRGKSKSEKIRKLTAEIGRLKDELEQVVDREKPGIIAEYKESADFRREQFLAGQDTFPIAVRQTMKYLFLQGIELPVEIAPPEKADISIIKMLQEEDKAAAETGEMDNVEPPPPFPEVQTEAHVTEAVNSPDAGVQ